MSLRVLLVGGRGMAGHMIASYLASLGSYELFFTSRHREDRGAVFLDAANQAQIAQVMTTIRPSIVVNAVGVLNQACDDEPARTILLNAYLPQYLASLGRQLGYRVIHISTDCVFSGASGGYDEGSLPDANSLYARTKLLGELRAEPDLTIRTSIVGPELKDSGIGLFGWFMRQSGQVKGYGGVFWTGLTTLALAKVVDAAIQQGVGGLYHVVPVRKISKYDLLCLFQEAFGKTDVHVVFDDAYRSDKSLTSVKPPFVAVPDYPEMIEELRDWIASVNYRMFVRSLTEGPALERDRT